MSRQSIDKVAASRDPATRQDLWEVMVGFKGGWFTLPDLFRETWMNRRTITTYLDCLRAGGVLERGEAPPSDSPVKWRYRLLPERPPFHAPRFNRKGEPVTQGQGNENMWRTMRMMGTFDANELAEHATTPTAQVSITTAKAYITALLQAGYLKVVRKAAPYHARLAQYRLIRNTGPLAPMIQRVQRVWDPNTEEAHAIGRDRP